ncbi:MAG: hypothetical protein M1839_008283 [Geoglossum umbratile]|nr:MAG: hypothetical protein M1839_008283 [Geoglossum umbratile]
MPTLAENKRQRLSAARGELSPAQEKAIGEKQVTDTRWATQMRLGLVKGDKKIAQERDELRERNQELEGEATQPGKGGAAIAEAATGTQALDCHDNGDVTYRRCLEHPTVQRISQNKQPPCSRQPAADAGARCTQG